MKRLVAFAVVAFAVVAMTSASLAVAELTDGLVLYMPLDEDGGATVADLSPNGFEGEIRGNPSWVDGRFGKALQFASSSDLVSIPTSAELQIEGAITQSAWINLDRLPGAHAIICGTRGGGGGRLIGFGFGMDPENHIKVWTNNPAGGFLDIDDLQTVLEPGEWRHIAYTHTTDDSGVVKIYVDGELTHEQDSNNPVAPAETPTEVTIGTWSGEAWPGAIDEARIWNRALSGAEIAESMDLDPTGFLAVDPQDKLATEWGRLKRATKR